MVSDQEDDHGENHKVRVKQKEHAGVVETPLSSEATARLAHPPRGEEQHKHLPWRAVELFDMREAGQAQAGDECGKREEDPAHERALPQPKDGRAEKHGFYNCRWRGLPSDEFHVSERLGIRCAQDPAFGDDGRYVLRRCHVEGGIADADAVRC